MPKKTLAAKAETARQKQKEMKDAFNLLIDAIRERAMRPIDPFASVFHAITEPTQSVPGGFAQQITDTVAKRGNTYGSPAENHQVTADMLTAWFTRRYGVKIVVSAEDVCLINVIQKVSRLAGKTNDDSLLDVAGYIENVAMIRPDQRNTNVRVSGTDKK